MDPSILRCLLNVSETAAALLHGYCCDNGFGKFLI